MSARAKNDISNEDLDVLLKTYVSSHSVKGAGLWGSTADDQVLESFFSFYQALAVRTDRLSSNSLRRLVLKRYALSESLARQISDRFVGVFAYARKKNPGCWHGGSFVYELGRAQNCVGEPRGPAAVDAWEQK